MTETVWEVPAVAAIFTWSLACVLSFALGWAFGLADARTVAADCVATCATGTVESVTDGRDDCVCTRPTWR